MLRVITILFLLSAFGLQTFYRVVIVADYYANKATFAQNCENKARPQLKCHGKCQMMKKLQEEEQKEQQNPERKMENKNEIVSASTRFATTPPQTIFEPRIEYQELPVPGTVTRSYAIFHPPAASV